MKKNIVKFLVLFFIVFGFTVDGMAEFPDDTDKPPTQEQMKKVRKRIETLRMWKLTKALDLDENTSAQLFPVLNRYDKQRAELERALWTSMKELRDTLGERREGRLKEILEKLENDHKALQRINDEERAEVKRILNIEQQAKFVLFQVEFNKEIRRIIAEAKDKRQRRL